MVQPRKGNSVFSSFSSSSSSSFLSPWGVKEAMARGEKRRSWERERERETYSYFKLKKIKVRVLERFEGEE